jgi:hypothetical protein
MKTTEYAVENDCKMVMNYINTDDNAKKLQWCKKNFEDELSLEKRLMGLNTDSVYQAIDNCVFNNNVNLFDNSKFEELMKKASILPISSFMELSNSESEIDDYDDDDEVVSEKKSQKINKQKKTFLKRKQVNDDEQEETEEVNLIEKNMSHSETDEMAKEKMMRGLKKNSKKDLVFNKPRDDKTKADKEKTAIFRNMQMAKLQGRHTFQQANRENINENFSLGKASLGKDNADEFVSFLGYLRDASYKASQLIAKKEEQQLAKILHESAPAKKKGLTVED